MPPRPNRPSDRDKVEAAISKLTAAGDDDLADAVRHLAERAPGWDARPPKGVTQSFKADKVLLTRVQEKATSKGDVTAAILAGARRFLDGELQPSRTVRGEPDSKDKVTIRVPDDLLQALDGRCVEVSAELGWKVRPVNVYVAALEEFAPAE